MDIYSIGHSTHSKQEFLSILHYFCIKVLVDVRSYPGSRHVPHFSKQSMPFWLNEQGISYVHIPKLGGRRRKGQLQDSSLIAGWDNEAFKNYSAYTLSDEYEQGLLELLYIAKDKQACIMCAESVPWRCHRMLISNSLVVRGAHVLHIMDKYKVEEHQLDKYGAKTSIQGERIIYPKI